METVKGQLKERLGSLTVRLVSDLAIECERR